MMAANPWTADPCASKKFQADRHIENTEFTTNECKSPGEGLQVWQCVGVEPRLRAAACQVPSADLHARLSISSINVISNAAEKFSVHFKYNRGARRII